MILLDTNICIHIINARPPAVLQRFRDYRMGEIGLCSVVAAETALWCYGDLRTDLERHGTPIGALDMLIAPKGQVGDQQHQGIRASARPSARQLGSQRLARPTTDNCADNGDQLPLATDA